MNYNYNFKTSFNYLFNNIEDIKFYFYYKDEVLFDTMKLLLSIPIPILVADNNYLFKKGMIPTLRRALEMGLNN